MPYSYSLFKTEVREYFLSKLDPQTKILDVGCGSGGYSQLLKQDFPLIDGIEIHEPYVGMFNLRAAYNNLIIGNILDFDVDGYELIIMGDVLEHITFPEAKNLLEKIHSKGIKMMVAVPYLYEQGAEFDNVHETHLQPDLTEELFLMRYPMMHLIFGDNHYGYFTNF
jgi:2-polyprenyl-3-methyl-5-hydroxy-6-metoxy-1,4-benzoquinol methylase